MSIRNRVYLSVPILTAALAFTVGVGLMLAPCGSALLFAGAPSTASVLEKAVAAHGGIQNLKKFVGHPYETRKHVGKLFINDQAYPLEALWFAANPDRWRYAFEIQVNDYKLRNITVFNRGEGWFRFVGNPTEKIPQDVLAESKTEHIVHGPHPMLVAMFEGKLKLGDASIGRIDDHSTWRVPILSQESQKPFVHFDQKSGLIRGYEYLGHLPGAFGGKEEDKQIPTKVAYHGYREIDGVKVADQLTVYRKDRKALEIRESSFAFPTTLDEKLFQKP